MTGMHEHNADTFQYNQGHLRGQSSDRAVSNQPEAAWLAYERAPEAGKVSLRFLPGGIARISLGSELDRAVTFSAERIQSLKEVVASVEKLVISDRVKGVLITSDHPALFCAGADLNGLAAAKDKESVHTLIREGQELFSKIRNLPVMTVAAVNGVCFGGALELALNCDAIIAANNSATKFAFPEVELGILPGWTGTQVTPRKIGLPQALKIMLAGSKPIDVERAARMGLIEGTSSAEGLQEAALSMIAGTIPVHQKQLSLIDRALTYTRLGRHIATHGLRLLPFGKKSIAGAYDLLRARGVKADQYPAPYKIIESAVYGLQHGIEAGILNEAKLEAELGASSQCKAFTNLFFANESAKRLGKGADLKMEQVDALVIGAGVMGAGIGAVLAKSGSSVTLKDPSAEQLERAKLVVAETLDHSKKLSKERRNLILESVEYSQNPQIDSKNLVIEVVPEIMDLKKKILTEVSKAVSESAIIATNTSSLSISDMAVAIKNPQRFAGLHFFNPPEKMKLVEIIAGEQTSPDTVQKLAAAVLKMGKIPVVASNVPGFLVNRILMPYLNEAGFLLTEGASIKDIDKAATAFGMPMGPLLLLDKIGLDTAEHVGKVIHAGYADRMKAPQSFAGMLEQGKKGEKSGAGFYDYAGGSPRPSIEVQSQFHNGASAKGITPDLIQRRLILSMVNEAVRCLDEGVSVNKGREGAMQIDLASVFGFGFAPFRGGLIQYAESMGAEQLEAQLEALEPFGERFTPAPGIVERARSGKSFYEPLASKEI